MVYHRGQLPPEEFEAWERVGNSSFGIRMDLKRCGETQGIEGIMEIARRYAIENLEKVEQALAVASFVSSFLSRHSQRLLDETFCVSFNFELN
jgi:hypothetical protein